jgi:FAD/FMN-containing dehydrogenase
MSTPSKMRYLSQVEESALGQTLSEWQARFPQMGVCAFLPEAQKEAVEVLQSVCAKKGVPLVGAIFPALVVGGNFETEGVWLLRFDVMPDYALHADLPTDIEGAELKSREIAQHVSSKLAGVDEATLFMLFDAMEKKYRLRCINVFHAGDGNLHPLILYDANVPGELERTEAFGAEILKLSVDLGGTITGEHGVGYEKINSMCDQFGSDELRAFHAVKRAFDPEGLLNPEKGVPTLHRCAEFGRMHVHGGQIKFPELERL